MIDDRSALLIRIDRLEVENEVLRQKLEQLQPSLPAFCAPESWKLGPQKAWMLDKLMSHERVSREVIFSSMPIYWADEEARDSKVVDVQMCRLRKTVRKFGARIETLWGWGYFIAPEHKAIIRQAIGAVQ